MPTPTDRRAARLLAGAWLAAMVVIPWTLALIGVVVLAVMACLILRSVPGWILVDFGLGLAQIIIVAAAVIIFLCLCMAIHEWAEDTWKAGPPKATPKPHPGGLADEI
jgi:hypothetical protein